MRCFSSRSTKNGTNVPVGFAGGAMGAVIVGAMDIPATSVGKRSIKSW
jgi:hypothetical protein